MGAPRIVPPLPPFGRTPERDAIQQELASMKPGERRSYESLADALGFDVRTSRMAGMMRRARDQIRRMHGRVIVAVPDWGLECLVGEKVVGLCDQRREQARRRAQRGKQELDTLDMENLSRDLVALANALYAQAGAVLASTSRAAQRRLVEKQAEQLHALGPGEFLEATRDLFGRRLGGRADAGEAGF